MGFFEKFLGGKSEKKQRSADEELGDDDFEITEAEPIEDNRDPEMMKAKVDESGRFGQPRVFSKETLDKKIGSPESDAENTFLDGMAEKIVSEEGGPFGRLIAPYDDLKRQLRQRLSSALQNLRKTNETTPMSSDEMRASLLKEGVDIASEIFEANKSRIEKGLDSPRRKAA